MTIDVTIIKKSILTIEIVLVLVLVFIYYLVLPIESEKIIYIQKGSVKRIITQLADNNSGLFNIDTYILRLFFGKPQQGWIDLKHTTLTKADYLYAITHEKAAVKSITLVPGETAVLFLDYFAQQFALDKERLLTYYEKRVPWKDGFLIPQTYSLPMGLDEESSIGYLVTYATRFHEDLAIKIFGTYNEKRWLRYLIIASIIQKEAANVNEMPIVASVIYNRLAKKMPLQMDGTLNYGYFSHQKVTPYRIRHDETRFNTYRYRGLPEYPVCAISIDAIKASVSPLDTDFLYFMRNKDGIHDFSRYFSTHRKNIDIVKKGNKSLHRDKK